MGRVKSMMMIATLLATAATVAGAGGSIAHVQVKSFGAPVGMAQRVATSATGGPIERHVLRLQATSALAFDVVSGVAGGELVVRLYDAVLGELPENGEHPFGTLTIEEEAGGDLLLTLTPSSPEYAIAVRQGRHANIVRIEVSR